MQPLRDDKFRQQDEIIAATGKYQTSVDSAQVASAFRRPTESCSRAKRHCFGEFRQMPDPRTTTSSGNDAC